MPGRTGRQNGTMLPVLRRGLAVVQISPFKNVFGKTASSAVLENDFKKTAKVMPTDRNQLADPYYAAQCMSACNWELVRHFPSMRYRTWGVLRR